MYSELLKVPKTLKKVLLWVHPEGRVVGSIYLRKQSTLHAGPELPIEALNYHEPFIVFMRDDSDMRFYNRRAIVRVEYEGRDQQVTRTLKPIKCEIHLMDGALFQGHIEEPLHPDNARLLDYLNEKKDKFIKLITSDVNTILINKSYIMYVEVRGNE